MSRRRRKSRPSRPSRPARTLGRPVARLNPDSVPVLWAGTVVTLAIGIASFLWSWDALQDVALWASVAPSRAWVVPVVIDGALVAYTIAVLVISARGIIPGLAWVALILFTVVSVYFNAAHAWALGADLLSWQRYSGTALAGLAPLAVLLATHTLADLLIERAALAETAPVAVPDAVPDAVPSLALVPAPEVVPVADVVPSPEPVPAVVSASRVPARIPSRRPAPVSTSDSDALRPEAVRLRTEERLTVGQIAEALGVPRSTAGRWVAGIPAVPLAVPVTA